VDKHNKLERYSHKDYSDLVDFPVEIVGRDGVIRRYTFEDSVRLYQRRVTFAPIRYRDRELIDAEVAHCRHRIEQLRRSFFYRFGWGTPEGEPDPEDVFGDLAGEIAAFLCRVLRADDRPDVRFEPVQPGQGGVGTWLLIPGGSAHGMLLHVHRFAEGERDVDRDAFFAMLKVLETSDDAERLIAFHHATDCGLVLTAPAGRFEALVSLTDDDGIIRDVAPSAWERAVDQVRLGRLADALDAAQQVVSSQALDRRAYTLGAALAHQLDRPADRVSFAEVGALYFPDDPDLRLWLGVGRAGVGDRRGALEPLERMLRADPESALARLALLPVLARSGRLGRAARLALSPPTGAAEDPGLAQMLREVARATRLALAVAALGVVSQGLGLVTAALYGWAGLVVAACGFALTALAGVGYGIEVRRLFRSASFGDAAWWARRLVSGARAAHA
jgi:hypothetical protein